MNTNERIKIFKSLMGQAFSKEEVDYFVAIFRRMGYFTAPASTKYHGNYEGGLFDHSLEVTKSLLHLTKHLKLHWNSRKSPYFVGMFHDLCKCDNYIHNGDGTYSYNPNVTLPGHGEKSLVLLAANEIGVTEEEKACIRCLASTTISGDGIYAEYTFNGDKQEMYEDVYGKLTNTCITQE